MRGGLPDHPHAFIGQRRVGVRRAGSARPWAAAGSTVIEVLGLAMRLR